MGLLLRGAAVLADDASATVDVLTVQVATVLWRLGRPASIAEMSPMIALAQGRPAGLRQDEQTFLEASIDFLVTTRAARGLAGVIQRSGGEQWTLTDTAHSILGLWPGPSGATN